MASEQEQRVRNDEHMDRLSGAEEDAGGNSDFRQELGAGPTLGAKNPNKKKRKNKGLLTEGWTGTSRSLPKNRLTPSEFMLRCW